VANPLDETYLSVDAGVERITHWAQAGALNPDPGRLRDVLTVADVELFAQSLIPESLSAVGLPLHR
jgi:hypothetical protein